MFHRLTYTFSSQVKTTTDLTHYELSIHPPSRNRYFKQGAFYILMQSIPLHRWMTWKIQSEQNLLRNTFYSTNIFLGLVWYASYLKSILILKCSKVSWRYIFKNCLLPVFHFFLKHVVRRRHIWWKTSLFTKCKPIGQTTWYFIFVYANVYVSAVNVNYCWC